MSPEAKTCRWALLGLSSIAVKFVKDLLLPRGADSKIHHEIVALSTTGTVSRASRWLAEQNVPNAANVAIHTSYQAMLCSDGYDIVYISTPQACHYQHTWDALSCKRNVLLEKPAVMNQEQYQRLAAHAKAQGVILMEAMWTRYLPATHKFVTDVLPRLGTVKRIFADFSLPIIDDPHLDPASRFLDKNSGAGSIVDLGMYPLTWVDLALHGASSTAGSGSGVDVVHANTITHSTPSGEIDDITTAILTRREPPCTAIVTTTLSIPGSAVPHHDERLVIGKNAPSIRIQGTHAEAAVAFPPIRPERIVVTHYGSDRVDERGFEVEETVDAEVYGWGLWYQADVIAGAVLERREKGEREGGGEGKVIGEMETVRVLGYLDRIRMLAGIGFGDQLEKPWLGIDGIGKSELQVDGE